MRLVGNSMEGRGAMGLIGGFRHGHCDPILVALLRTSQRAVGASGPSTNHNGLTPVYFCKIWSCGLEVLLTVHA